jgi:hypothetical protein
VGVGALGKKIASGTGSTTTPSKVRKEKSIAEIRRLVSEGYSHNDIMEQLNLPPRTYFRYLSEAFDHDWQLLKQENNSNNAALLALEISKLKETFRSAQRTLEEMIDSP